MNTYLMLYARISLNEVKVKHNIWKCKSIRLKRRRKTTWHCSGQGFPKFDPKSADNKQNGQIGFYRNKKLLHFKGNNSSFTLVPDSTVMSLVHITYFY
jgi:hypothetical protein